MSIFAYWVTIGNVDVCIASILDRLKAQSLGQYAHGGRSVGLGRGLGLEESPRCAWQRIRFMEFYFFVVEEIEFRCVVGMVEVSVWDDVSRDPDCVDCVRGLGVHTSVYDDGAIVIRSTIRNCDGRAQVLIWVAQWLIICTVVVGFEMEVRRISR
eukprot:1392754-Amorphochlora_amoeboformis.AAC.1